MPIYAYRCTACGYQNDYLQKISEPLLTECPECGKSTFQKQVTAAGFQLKGSGWYVTDFRDNGKKAKPSSGKDESKSGGEKSTSDKSGSDKSGGDKSSSESSSSSSSDSGSKPATSAGSAGATPA